MQELTTFESEEEELRREVQRMVRRAVLQTVEYVVEVELVDALGSERHQRTGERRGYRNGHTQRTITTPVGEVQLDVPRGRIFEEDGSSREFQSEVLPRYARRTREVDEAILGIYLAGGNSRRIRKALSPLVGEKNLSKSAVSRIVGRLKKQFAEWCGRDLSEERYAILFLDGFHLKVRLARRVVTVPVLAAMGVTEDGSKRLVALRLATSEAAAHWSWLIEDLGRRGLASPELVVTDGHAGLKKAVKLWPQARVQRCTRHKWSNLVEHCPVHARGELKRDYDRIIQARNGMEGRAAYDAFLVKWRKLCPAVSRSLEEAGLQLLTFYEFPRSMWKSIRTTNSLENLNREFRRRTKTQASFGTEDAALTLLYGLVAFGQIRMRKIDGYRHVASMLPAA